MANPQNNKDLVFPYVTKSEGNILKGAKAHLLYTYYYLQIWCYSSDSKPSTPKLQYLKKGGENGACSPIGGTLVLSIIFFLFVLVIRFIYPG